LKSRLHGFAIVEVP
jgi:hypothetical protein